MAQVDLQILSTKHKCREDASLGHCPCLCHLAAGPMRGLRQLVSLVVGWW